MKSEARLQREAEAILRELPKQELCEGLGKIVLPEQPEPKQLPPLTPAYADAE